MITFIKSSPKHSFFAFMLSFGVMGVVITVLNVFADTGATVPASISADCSRNVSSELNSWLSSVPDDSTIQFAPNGCYRIDQTISLTNRANLIVDGQNATFKTDDPTGDGSTLAAPSVAARARSHWRISNSNNVVIKNMIIKGANSNAGQSDAAYLEALEAQHGLVLSGVKNVEVANITITDVYGDFVYLGIGINGWSDGVRVHRSRFERNGRQGVSIIAARNVLIDNNYIGDTRRTTFDFEPNSPAWGSDSVVIDSNEIGPGRLLLIAAGGQGPIDRLTITNNTFNRNAGMSFVGNKGGGRMKSVIIEGNTSTVSYDSSSGHMIGVSYIDGLRYNNNTNIFKANKDMKALNILNTTDIVARGNTLINGVGVLVSTGSTITQQCGNRYSSSSAFNQPVACPAAGQVTTSPQPQPAPSPTSPAGGSGTSKPSNSGSNDSSAAADGSTSTESGGVAKTILEPLSSIAKSLTIINDSKEPPTKRLGVAALVLILASACLLAVWALVRFGLHIWRAHDGRYALIGGPLGNTVVSSIPTPPHKPGDIFGPSDHHRDQR